MFSLEGLSHSLQVVGMFSDVSCICICSYHFAPGWIAVTFCTDVHGFSIIDPLTFPPVPL